MSADRLRASILQAAISGQLTEQRPEDGTAVELLEQIAEARAELVKEKKLKKQKPLPQVAQDEQEFRLPENWIWVNLGETISLLSGRDLTREQYSDRPTGIPYITGASNFVNGSLAITRWTEQPLTVAQKGDLLITCKGTIGELAVLQENEAHVARQVMAITCLEIRRDYVAAFLEYSVSDLKAQAKSMIPGISRDMLLLTPLPLPPLAEQERIIAKLDEVLPLIDQLAELEREREHLDREFATAIERSILQAAISGKLTKQQPEDGTAAELLESIKTERQQLEKEGRIKKQKPLPPVTSADEAFELPSTWRWVRLGQVGSWAAGSTPSRSKPELYGGEIPWIKSGEVKRGQITASDETITEKALSMCSMRLNPPGSVLVAMYGANIGDTGVLRIPAATNQAVCACIPFDGVDSGFLSYVLRFSKEHLKSRGAGGAQPNISRAKIIETAFPLAPHPIQLRAVSILDCCFPLIQDIKELVA